MRTTWIFLVCFHLIQLLAHSQSEEAAVHITFDEGQPLDLFEYSDSSSWRIYGEKENKVLELFRAGDYQPPFRSPLNIAVLKSVRMGDFILEVDLKQTGREYGHRDMCLFFGVNSPSNYYYVHIASAADQNAHGIFLVNDEDRKNISTNTTSGIKWGSDWHRVKVVRRVDTGEINVYFDDLDTPIMKAVDKHFPAGFIGFGSFDDTGQVDNIRLKGKRVGAARGFFK